MSVWRPPAGVVAVLATAAVVVIVAVVALIFDPVGGHIDFHGLEGANILLVTLDTTRADRIGCYGYPAAETPVLDSLAADGVLFESCITPTAFTLPSHSSIMTGFYPPFHGVRLNGGVALADIHHTLAERLTGNGYRSGAFVGAFVLDRRWGLMQGFEHYDDDFELDQDQRLDLAGVQRPADHVVDAAIEWLEQSGDAPFFAWVHLYDPHIPYEPPEPYLSRFRQGGQSSLYDGEIAFADSQLGRLLEWLDAQGATDDTVVVVVGDHGEGLGDHDEDEHGFFIYDSTVQVPFLIRLPVEELRGTRVPHQVRTIDVMPTLLDLVGVEAPGNFHGESLVPIVLDPTRQAPRYAYGESMAVSLQYGWSALYSLRSNERKFIQAPRRELYDLAEDPNELDNLYSSRREVADELQTALESIRTEIETDAPETQQANLDEDTLSMLAALGYVGGATTGREGESLADPKDKIHLFEAVGYASHQMVRENYGEAAEVLEIVLAEDPDIPQARLLLATSYQETGQMEEAKVVLDEYLRVNPDDARALITMAGILSEEGRKEEVLAICRRALAVDNRNVQAYELMAGVHMDSAEHGDALPLLRRVVEIQPKLTRNRNDLAASLIGVGQLVEAEDLLDDILAEYPNFPLANFNLGLLYEEQGRMAEAREAYEVELAQHPHVIPARFNLGNLMLRMGDRTGAEEQLRAAMESAPDEPRPYLLLARMHLAEGTDLAAAEGLARQGLERSEAAELKVLGYYILADVYSRQGRRSEIPGVLQKAEYYRAQIEAEEAR